LTKKNNQFEGLPKARGKGTSRAPCLSILPDHCGDGMRKTNDKKQLENYRVSSALMLALEQHPLTKDEIALQAGITSKTLIELFTGAKLDPNGKILSFDGKLEPDDPRIIKIGRILGIPKNECFEIGDPPEDIKWHEILKLKGTIQDAAFHKKPSEGEETLEFYSRIRVFNALESIRRKPIKEDLDKGDLKTITVIIRHIDSFLWTLSELIWQHKQDMRPEAGEELLEELQQQTVTKTKMDLQEKGWPKSTIRQIARFLKNDKALTKSIRKFKDTRTFKYFLGTNPKGYDWKARETHAMRTIQKLYNDTFNKEIYGEGMSLDHLSQRQIISNMAIVLEATDFLPGCEDGEPERRIAKYNATIKKRLQRSPEIEMELCDPTP